MRIFRWTLATRRRRTVAGILAVLAIPALAVTWWLGSPLFLNKTVNEEFPLTVSAEIPPDMKRADVEMVMEVMAKVDTEMTEAMPDAARAAEKLSTGAFRDQDRFHLGSGEAALYLQPTGEYLLRLENFSVTNGPDLHLLLSTHADPNSGSEVKDDGYIDLGKLKGNRGSQNYEIPDGVDATQYRSVVVYCKPFHVIFSVAPLSPAGGG